MKFLELSPLARSVRGCAGEQQQESKVWGQQQQQQHHCDGAPNCTDCWFEACWGINLLNRSSNTPLSVCLWGCCVWSGASIALLLLLLLLLDHNADSIPSSTMWMWGSTSWRATWKHTHVSVTHLPTHVG